MSTIKQTEDADQIVHDAKLDWVKRGNNPDDFTMEKMIEIWEKENEILEKEIEENKEEEEKKEEGKESDNKEETNSHAMRNNLRNVLYMFSLDYFSDKREIKELKQKHEKQQEQINKLNEERRQIRKKRKELLEKQAKIEEEQMTKFKEIEPTKIYQQKLTQAVREEEKNKLTKEAIQERLDFQQKILAEKKEAKLQKEKEREKERIIWRQKNIENLNTQEKEARAELAVLKEKEKKREKENEEWRMRAIENEIMEHNKSNLLLENNNNNNNNNELIVKEGENDNDEDIGDEDIIQIEPNMSEPYDKYEKLKQKYDNANSSLIRYENEFDVNNNEIEAYNEEILTLKDISEHYISEMEYLECIEREVMKKYQNAKYLIYDEKTKESVNMRKKRIIQLKSDNNEIIETIRMIMKNIHIKKVENLKLSEIITQQQKKCDFIMEQMQNTFTLQSQLPMVVGYKITAKELGQPKQNEIEVEVGLRSQFEILKKQVEDALTLNSAIKNNLHSLDESKGEMLMLKSEYNNKLNYLEETKLKLLKFNQEMQHRELLDALKRFFSERQELKKVNQILSGFLNWWSYGDRANKKEDIDRFEPYGKQKQSIRLGKYTTGIYEGRIPLPLHSLWEIHFVINKEKEDDKDSGDPSDCVTVYMGSNKKSLAKVARIRNIPPEGRVNIRYSVTSQLRGNQIVFRFEYTCASDNPSSHLIIQRGWYRQDSISTTEITTGNTRLVVSEYVKLLRIERITAGNRLSQLQEEYQKVKSSKEKYYDSMVIHETPQRYLRTQLLKVLKEEILKEEKRQGSQLEGKKFKSLQNVSDETLTAQQRLEIKLRQSRERYIERKRKGKIMDKETAYSYVGKVLEALDPIYKKWRIINVMDVAITESTEFTEGSVHHLIQYSKDKFGPGRKEWVDITLLQFNQLKEVVPLKEPSEVFMERVKKEEEDKEYFKKHKMTLLKQDRNVQLQELSNWREEFYEKKKKAFEKANEIAVQEADKKAEEPEMLEQYKQAAPFVKKDMANGINTEDGNPKQITLQEAEIEAKKIYKKKFIDSFMKNVEADWMNREENMIKKEEEEKQKLQQQWEEEDKDFDYRQELEEIESRNKAKQKRIEKTKSITIPNYNQCIPLQVKCEHRVLQNWKTLTSSGIRCRSCNKSLTNYYNDKAQQLGGYDNDTAVMNELIEAHRKTHGALTIKENKTLLEIEKRRLQIEKERREVELSEISFNNVTMEDELVSAAILHHIPLQEVPEDLIFRRDDMLHKASFHKLTSKYIHIHQYNQTIEKIKQENSIMTSERIALNHRLVKLHKYLVTIFDRINAVEQEYCRAGDMLNERKNAHIRVSELEFEIIRTKRLVEAANRRLRVYDTKRRDYQRNSLNQQDLIKELQKMNEIQRERLILSDKVLKECQEHYEQCLKSITELTRTVCRIQYMKSDLIVRTMYGYGRVKAFRPEGEMLVVQLCWGGLLYITASSLNDFISEQEAMERELMEVEDKLSLEIEEHDRNINKMTISAMKKEEYECKLVWKHQYFVENEFKMREEFLKKLEDDIDNEMKNKSLIKKIREEARNEIKEELTCNDVRRAMYDKQVAELNRLRAENPNSEECVNLRFELEKMPKIPKSYTPSEKEEKINNYIEWAISEYPKKEKENRVRRYDIEAKKRKHDFFLQETAEMILDEFLVELLPDCIIEVVNANEAARDIASRECDFTVRDCDNIPFHMFMNLITVNRRRKEMAKKVLKSLGGEDAEDRAHRLRREYEMKLERGKEEWLMRGLPANEFSVEALEEIWDKEKKEKEHEQMLEKQNNDLMKKEEEMCRAFYKWELKQNSKERWLMREEELAMRELMRQEQLNQMKSKYDIAGEDNVVSVKINRREEVKRLVAERQKMRQECQLMQEEDELAQQIRAEEIRIRDQKQMEIEGLLNKDVTLDDINLDDGYESSDISDDSDVDEDIEIHEVEKPIIYWYQHILNDINKWREKYQNIEKEIRSYYEIMYDKENRTREERKLARHRVRQLRLKKRQERKGLNYVETLGIESVIKLALTELDYINWEEKLPGAEEAYKQDIDNSKYVKEYLERKQIELKQILIDYEVWKGNTAQAQIKADKCLEDLKKNEKDLSDARLYAEEMDEKTKYIDSAIIHGEEQRFTTIEIYEKLNKEYFKLLVETIVTKAEVICKENHLMMINEKQQSNMDEMNSKIIQIQKIKFKLKRDEYMHLYRSELNKLIFGKSRKTLLTRTFNDWKEYKNWKISVKDVYNLKHDLILHEKRLNMYFDNNKKTDDEDDIIALTEGENIMASTSSLLSHSTLEPIMCRNCKQLYLPQANNSNACHFHPGIYILTCPKSCKGYGPDCATHLMKRWTCCEDTDEGSSGCKVKWHMAQNDDNNRTIYYELQKKEMASTLFEKEVEKEEKKIKNDTFRAGKDAISKSTSLASTSRLTAKSLASTSRLTAKSNKLY